MFFSFLLLCDSWLSPNLPQCINDNRFYHCAISVPLSITRQDLTGFNVAVPPHTLPSLGITPRTPSIPPPDVS